MKESATTLAALKDTTLLLTPVADVESSGALIRDGVNVESEFAGNSKLT
jgi:hypothetical protein